MTLSSWLSPDLRQTGGQGFTPFPDIDRTHWKGGGGWKGGKGNPNAALSALTLLAFLFFLNILQNCLKDTMGQNNGMMVVMLPANLTANRFKRELDNKEFTPLPPAQQDWTESQIMNLVHNNVESHWVQNDAKLMKCSSHQFCSKNSIKKNVSFNKAKTISTKLNMISQNSTIEKLKINKQINKQGQVNLKTKKKLDLKVATENTPTNTALWTKAFGVFIKRMKPYLESICCCININGTKKTRNNHTKNYNLLILLQVVRHSTTWLCADYKIGGCSVPVLSQCHNSFTLSVITKVTKILQSIL